ncbi:MAG: TIGR04282 family arsenosugar biosynthesis glycosyltransferase [Pseudonocardiaceae bacterium]
MRGGSSVVPRDGRGAARSTPRAALLVLAKAPVPGKVKTRLCPPATLDQAARIAAAALLDTLDAVLAVPHVIPVVALTGDLANAVDATALTARLRATTVLPQRGTTLGQRIAAAHSDAAAVAGQLPVLQVGMDSPQVDAALFGQCLDLLDGDGVDAVYGPAADGGWWALGVRRPAVAELIAHVPTSLPDTGALTLAVLRESGCRVVELPELSDVDTWEDATAVAADVPGGRFAAAVTALSPQLGSGR